MCRENAKNMISYLQLSTSLLYCIVTATIVHRSVSRQSSFSQWLISNDLALFMIWQLEFCICAFIFHVLNHIFVGPLRLFEKRKFRQHQIQHLTSSVLFIAIACGLDLFEIMCWMLWITPFIFVQMSIVVATQRFSNPCFQVFDSLDVVTDEAKRTLAYMFSLIPLISLWVFIGYVAFNSVSLWTKLLLAFEPLTCFMQGLVVCICCLLETDASLDRAGAKNDAKFFVQWINQFVAEIFNIIKFGSMWILTGHSLIFNVMDVLIFVKLKTAFKNLSYLINQLRSFLIVRCTIDKTFPTVKTDDTKNTCMHFVPTVFGQFINKSTEQIYNSVFRLFKNVIYALFAACHVGWNLFFTKNITEIYQTENFSQSTKFYIDPLNRQCSKLKSTNSSNLKNQINDKSLFKSKNTTDMDTPLCVVCREPMNEAKQLPCRHLIHEHCLQQWFESDLTCPVCRSACLNCEEEKKLKLLKKNFTRSISSSPDFRYMSETTPTHYVETMTE